MRSGIGLIVGCVVGFVTTAALLVVATGLLGTASMVSQGSLVGRPQVMVGVAISLLLGSFAGSLVGGRWIKGEGRTWFGLVVGVLLLLITVVIVLGAGIKRGSELVADPVANMVVPLASAIVGGLVGVVLSGLVRKAGDMQKQGDNRVFLTALGVVTPWGLGLEALREGLASGAALPTPAKCPSVDLKDFLPAEKTYLDRCSELALVGAALALREGGLLAGDHTLATGLLPPSPNLGEGVGGGVPGGEASDRFPPPFREGGGGVGAGGVGRDSFGLGLGTAYGCLDTMNANTQRVQTKGARLASPLLFMHSFINAPASLIAIEWGLRGPAATFAEGGLSAASALLWAWNLLQRGAVDLMLVGGVEALSDPLLRAVEADPSLARGATPLEAAVFIVAERAKVAMGRDARPLAEITRVSLSSLARRDTPGASERSDSQLALGPGGGYAFGAQFALRLAVAAAEGQRENASGVVSLQEGEGWRVANMELVWF